MTLLLAAASAASERSPISAASLNLGLEANAAADAPTLDASVEAQASVGIDAPLTLPGLPKTPSDPMPQGGRNGTAPPPRESGGNQTPPPANGTTTKPPPQQPPTPPTNETADAAAALSPHQQDVVGSAGHPIRFVLMLTNHASTAQNVSLRVRAPSGWTVELQPSSVLLGADEVAEIRGTIHTPRLVGTLGTILLNAAGSGGNDSATVEVCARGVLMDPCGAPPVTRHNGTQRNETAPPPHPPQPEPAANETEERPSNETSPPPPPPSPPQPPQSAPQPASSNGTSPPPGNETAPGGSSSPPPSGGGSASAEATVSIEAAANDKDESPPVEVHV